MCRYLTKVLLYKPCKHCDMNKIFKSYKTHNIAVDNDNYQTLKEFGRVGDSFNDVIARLIRIAKENELTR